MAFTGGKSTDFAARPGPHGRVPRMALLYVLGGGPGLSVPRVPVAAIGKTKETYQESQDRVPNLEVRCPGATSTHWMGPNTTPSCDPW